MEREQISEEVMVKDPRTVEECVHASDLLNLVLVSTHSTLNIILISVIRIFTIGHNYIKQ